MLRKHKPATYLCIFLKSRLFSPVVWRLPSHGKVCSCDRQLITEQLKFPVPLPCFLFQWREVFLKTHHKLINWTSSSLFRGMMFKEAHRSKVTTKILATVQKNTQVTQFTYCSELLLTWAPVIIIKTICFFFSPDEKLQLLIILPKMLCTYFSYSAYACNTSFQFEGIGISVSSG